MDQTALHIQRNNPIKLISVSGCLRTMKVRLLMVLLLPIYLYGCSTPIQPYELSEEAIAEERKQQFIQALQYQFQQQLRLNSISYQLLKSSVPDCGQRTRYSIGLFLHNPSEYKAEQKPATEALYGSANKLTVKGIVGNGPSSSHLIAGDEILKINGEPSPYKTALALQMLKTATSGGQTVSLVINRDGSTINISVQPEKLCDYAVILSGSDSINGYADGSNIIITSGLMRFAQQDNQLALIIAHELAHNTLDHIPKRLQNGAAGLLLDLVLSAGGIPSPLIATGLGANLYSQSFETEADLEGIRLLHQAGYPIKGLDLFWREMAMVQPSTITQGPSISHPPTTERALRIRKYINELLSSE